MMDDQLLEEVDDQLLEEVDVQLHEVVLKIRVGSINEKGEYSDKTRRKSSR